MAFSLAFNAFNAAATTVTSGGINTSNGLNAYALATYTNDSSRVISSFSDNMGNTYNLLSGSPYIIATPGNTSASLYYCENITGGTGHTWTLGVSVGGSAMGIVGAVMSGRATAGSIRAFASAFSTSYAQSHAGATVTAVATDDIVCFSAEDPNTNGTETFTHGSGFAAIPTNGQNTAQGLPSFLQYQNNVSAGAVTGAFTTANFNQYVQVILALKTPAASSGLIEQMMMGMG
jgi:hypothetical protein